MRVFLSGLMGSGKSTIARALGERTRLPVIDLDARIESHAGARVTDIFRDRGEDAFRTLEAEVMNGVLEQNAECIVALGGGAVTSRALRRRLLREGFLVTLDASVDELVRRVGNAASRPLLAGQDVRARLQALRQARSDAYAECHLRVDTDALSASASAARILDAAKDAPIVVPLGTRSYRVRVGIGVRAQLPVLAAEVVDKSVVMLVSDTEVFPRWGQAVTAALSTAGLRVHSVTLPPGEAAKTLQSVDRLWSEALDAGLDRASLVIGLGGGVIGDLSGFAAATLLRGVRVAHVPTTLLAMVDSAIGGKTGFDTRHGKNLVGAIHQPSFVLSDIEVLQTLPEVERRAGLAEVVKSAWIVGESAVAELERDADALRSGEPEATLRAIRMAASMKAYVVGEDETESGLRAVLNLGHTVGHAIEAAQGFSGLRHGEAVALGMVAAFRLSVGLGRARSEDALRMRELLARLGLPVDVERHLSDHVLAFLTSDKKRQAKQIKYIVPAAPGDVTIEPLPISEITRLLRA
jgi:shikimate kinase/3-dehydroquinate synthase